MAGSINKVTLLGHLGRDPEVRNFPNGGRVVNLRLATSQTWKDKATGERREKTEWHSIAIFVDGLGQVAERYLKKGSKVYIEGQLETRKWQDQQGQDKYTTEVVLRPYSSTLVMLDGRQQGDNQQGGQGGQPYRQNQNNQPARQNGQQGRGGPGYNDGGQGYGQGASYGGGRAEYDDDIPF